MKRGVAFDSLVCVERVEAWSGFSESGLRAEVEAWSGVSESRLRAEVEAWSGGSQSGDGGSGT